MSITIAVVNQKGGVGKTTTSVNVAAALARMGHKTLLIDLDPQSHSTEHLGVGKETKGVDRTVLDVLNKERELSRTIVPTYLDNLFVLPANLKLGQFNQLSPVGNQFKLKEALHDEVKDNFDYILVDCQPSLSLLTLNALTASDKVLLPVQAEFFALDGLSQLILTLKEVRTKLHPVLSVLGVVVTMFDRRNNLSGEIKNELEKNFGNDLFETYIPRSVRLAEAPSFGRSIFEYAPGSKPASAYKDLTQELIDKIEKEKVELEKKASVEVTEG